MAKIARAAQNAATHHVLVAHVEDRVLSMALPVPPVHNAVVAYASTVEPVDTVPAFNNGCKEVGAHRMAWFGGTGSAKGGGWTRLKISS